MYTHAQLAQHRMAEMHAQAENHRLAKSARPERELRERIGWTLVEVGLRLASPAPAIVP
ncbi:hypothetical protein [Streptomyces fuscichromogenes]|uniref:Uncharacterized protein n=1 Tax=Streptomyces fuscichromogenes TaxID=1324013 RepID=A0A917X8H1_9ACTN|nr:hypothetical protein [Streptomyces fuscichromogenes]GGM90390.1 hypothetical protein GCM10011578_007750 [Streptomyces fuscichromogenes]